MNGELIVLEGADGTGKSSLCNGLATRLRTSRRDVIVESFPGRRTGTLGSKIYDLHHGMGDSCAMKIDPTALQCLHIAAHLDAITTRVLPAVRSGSLVILDRYWWSTFVYGVVGNANRAVLTKLIEAEMLAWNGLKPSALFLIDRETPLRSEPLQLWHLLRNEYIALAEKEAMNHRIHVIRNSGVMDDALVQIVELHACPT